MLFSYVGIMTISLIILLIDNFLFYHDSTLKFSYFCKIMEKISKISSIVESSKLANEIKAFIDGGKSKTDIYLPNCSLRAAVSLFVAQHTNVCLRICQNEDAAGYLYQDARNLINTNAEKADDSIVFFPSLDGKQLDDDGRTIMRTRALEAIEKVNNLMIIAYPESLSAAVVSPTKLKSETISIKKGNEYDMDTLSEKFFKLGLTREEFVYQPGQFAIRGCIVDVFSYSSELPYRIDFFGDEVDSIRTFDTTNQLSVDTIDECTIVGNVLNAENAEKKHTLVDYLPKDTIVMMDNDEFVLGTLANRGAENAVAKIEKMRCLNIHGEKRNGIIADANLSPVFAKNYNLLADYIKKQKEVCGSVLIATENARQRERLETILSDLKIEDGYEFINGTLHSGFSFENVTLLVEHEIFGRYHRYQLTNKDSRRGKEALTLKELKNLSIGDFVVHDDFGIGVFGGLVMQRNGNIEQEMVRINYKDGGLIMVSLNSLHKVSKYRGSDSENVKISKLGGATWSNIKYKTKEKLKDIARDLILLYAMRKKEQGYSFSPDSFMQAELESNFEFQDTPDQAKATADVKRDMESARPMDRLVCGDVGFGKTEIAVRAALKAACDNKQVAVLVPTTVLAFQHYKTFSRRLKDLPVKVDYLSRTRSSSETKEVLKKLENGNINIIIGTHKLIGKSVKFHDLGLLIIDEEQKFGVTAKEKIKEMKVNVDTLTLTATPIPRTLQFSLLGARDLSVINTPPAGRYPVETHLCRFDKAIVSKAIEAELNRGGQVLFVNNNIKDLDNIKHFIISGVPTARVIIAHGKMSGEEIESAMLDFVQHEYDVLLSTSIIESGIDISNCNTIIINNAQNFGLSDLHQLRGRVGRSDIQAYCYLMAPPMEALSDESRKRLEAITTYTELGSGLNIAMRDLDIRGAGNLLGKEQSGFIADLGYETYKKILASAVEELRQNEFHEIFADDPNANNANEILRTDCSIETDLSALIPDDYVENVSERLSLYRELDSLQTEEDLTKFAKNLKDRFGEIPEQAQRLMEIVSIRFIANNLGFERLTFKNNHVCAYFTTDKTDQYFQSEIFGKILAYLQSHVERCKLGEKKGKPAFEIFDVQSLSETKQLLKEIINHKL